MKNAVLIVAVLALVGAAFFVGTLVTDASNPARGAFSTRGRGAMGGPFANMTDTERAALQSMTDEQRQDFLEEKGLNTNAMPANGTARGPARGGLLEGEIIEMTSDTITMALTQGGSQTVYYGEDTVVGYAENAQDMAVGSKVMLFAQSEADGVTTAQAIIVE